MSGFKGGYVFECVKTVIVAVVLSLLLVLAFAGIVTVFEMDAYFVDIFNMVIKGASVFLAVLICFRLPHNGWLRGVICGVVFALISYLVYGLISNSLCISPGLFADAALGGACGLVGGILSVNSKRYAV